MQSPKIEIKNLYKIYFHRMKDTLKESYFTEDNISAQDKIVVNNLNLTFNSGEVIGIVGPNGAGKSTLLSIIAGVTKETNGQVIINGKVTAVLTLGVGLREDLNGRENIYIDGELQGQTRHQIDEIIDEIIEFSELGEFIDKPVKCYSTGMKSRLAFSMLVCIEPEILIIDEALSAGDAFFAEKASKKIKELCNLGKIVIIVSHSMAAIQNLCNRCIWLEQGKVILDGEPQTVTEAYLDKVAEEDNLIELSYLPSELSHHTPSAKWVITEVNLKKDLDNRAQKVFYTKDPFAIEIVMRKPKSTDALINCSIHRLDGIMVDFKTVQLANDSLSLVEPENFAVVLSLNALVLNKGHYQLNIDLVENEETTNQMIRFFEVKNNRMAQGGVSLLDYPCDIRLITKDKMICSDLKEQMVD